MSILIAPNREGRDAHEDTDKNKQANSHEHDHSHEHGHAHDSHGHAHDSHDHVMSYTYYFSHPVNSVEFERLIAGRQGMCTGRRHSHLQRYEQPFLFQYAFRESDFMKITPQGQVPDVVVFIGEHFQKSLREQLEKLEGRQAGHKSTICLVNLGNYTLGLLAGV